MGFEQRSGNKYYYRKRRVGGKVVSEYVGRNAYASLAEWQDNADRAQRSMARQALADIKQEVQRVEGIVNQLHATVREAVKVGLQVAGFHQHKRTWRKTRQKEGSGMANDLAVQEGQRIFDEYNELLAAASAKKPKPADLERLRQYGVDHPGIFEGYSMLAKTTLADVIDSATTSEATKIHIKGEARALERNLGYRTSSAMERLLIKDIVLCWVRLQFFEQTYTHNYNTGDGVSLARADYLEKRLSATRRRYHQAIESLARVRGLLVRAGVQINVAGQQVVMNG